MTPTASEALYIPAQTCPPRKKWTRAECAALEGTGVWNQQHLELIWGDLINKMGKKKPHSIVITVINTWLRGAFGERYVYQEVPIDVAPDDNPTNEPEPDLIVLAKPLSAIKSDNATPADLRLLVEISDSTLSFDQTTKAELYARAGIIEYWIFDIPGRRLLVHRDPRDGQYRSVKAYSEEESASPLAAPDREFRVAEAFEGIDK